MSDLSLIGTFLVGAIASTNRDQPSAQHGVLKCSEGESGPTHAAGRNDSDRSLFHGPGVADVVESRD
jgi:hypothetical protein